MSETTAPPNALRDKGLATLFVGVITAPRETFEAVAAKPRWFGMLVIVTVMTAVLLGGFMATPVGQQAFLDKAQEGNPFGGTPSEQQMKATEKMAAYMPYIQGGGVLVAGPIVTALMAGLAFAIFSAFAGGQATYKQVFAVFVYSGVIGVVGQLIVTPVNYFRETLDSPMNLAVFFPMLGAGSFLAKVLGSVELFRVWWVVTLSIGLSVVYHKKTRSIAIALFVVYAIIAVTFAAISAARS
jgi:Yip1 domain